MNTNIKQQFTTVTTFSKIVAGILFIAMPFIGFYLGMQYSKGMNSIAEIPKPQPAVCTQEAKICSDGSSVGRTGPNCEFAACPAASDQVAGWKTYSNTAYGFEFKYPENWVSSISDDGILLTSPEHIEQNKEYNRQSPPLFDFSAGHLSSIDWFLENAKWLTGKDFTNLKNFLKDAYGNVAEINIDGKNAYATIVSTSRNDYYVYIETGKNTYILLSIPDIRQSSTFELDPKDPIITTEAKKIMSTFKFTK
ncbi:MAG: hypothetical protein Q7S57_04565 [bacterium]|nr:hypothetical protein [bacterium]